MATQAGVQLGRIRIDIKPSERCSGKININVEISSRCI
jgi:hypothetical protein